MDSGKLPSYLESQFLCLQNGDGVRASHTVMWLMPLGGGHGNWHKLGAQSRQDSPARPPQDEEHSWPTPLVTLEASSKAQLEIQGGGLVHKLFAQPGPVGAKQPPAVFTSAFAQESSGCPLVSDGVPAARDGSPGSWEA